MDDLNLGLFQLIFMILSENFLKKSLEVKNKQRFSPSPLKMKLFVVKLKYF